MWPLLLKACILGSALLLSTHSYAQTYTRGKKNFAVIPTVGIGYTHSSGHFVKGKTSLSFGLGMGMQFRNILFPSIHYRWQEPVASLSDNNASRSPFHTVAPQLLVKYPLVGYYTGKTRRYECKSVGVSGVAGIQYNFNMGKLSYGSLSNFAEFSVGFEVLFSRSGGSKRNKAYTVRIDILYKHAIESFAVSDNASWYTNQIALQFGIYKFKVYKFSDM